MMKKIVRGAMFYVDLPIVGSEQKGIRPVLIIQNDLGNKHSPTVLVAPISTKKDKLLSTHILIKQFDKLRHDFIVMLEQVRVLDKSRLKGYMGMLLEEQMKEVGKAMVLPITIIHFMIIIMCVVLLMENHEVKIFIEDIILNF